MTRESMIYYEDISNDVNLLILGIFELKQIKY